MDNSDGNFESLLKEYKESRISTANFFRRSVLKLKLSHKEALDHLNGIREGFDLEPVSMDEAEWHLFNNVRELTYKEIEKALANYKKERKKRLRHGAINYL